MWFQRNPDISNLRVFGSKAFAQIPKERRKKWDDTSHETFMISFNNNGYRPYDPARNVIKLARNVVFDERKSSVPNDVINLPSKDGLKVPVIKESLAVDHLSILNHWRYQPLYGRL